MSNAAPWSVEDWLDTLQHDPSAGPLPRRRLVVPASLAGHALRRLTAGRKWLRAGTDVLSAGQLAERVLREAGRAETITEDALRVARLRALFRRDLPLTYFPLELLRTRPGWDEAFAATISHLEAALLRPEDLEAACTDEHRARVADLCAIWRAADEAAGASVTTARACALAAAVLRDPARVRGATPVAALVSPTATAAELLLTESPHVTSRALATRPAPDREAQQPATEIDVLKLALFEDPSYLLDQARPRSSGHDGSVTFGEFAGVDEEIDAAVEWVGAQLVDGVPVNEIAVLLPSMDPLGAILIERLSGLPWKDGSLPVSAPEGVPLASSAAGARALAVVRALRAGLPADALAQVVPYLKRTGEAFAPSPSQATGLVWNLGAVGGSVTAPHEGLVWPARIDLRRTHADPTRPEKLAILESVAPAIVALTAVLKATLDTPAPSAAWTAVRTFLSEWLLQPGEGPRVQDRIAEHMDAVTAAASLADTEWDEGLRLVEEALTGTRVPVGDNQGAGVFVGTLARAALRPFDAVRVMGLAEGAFPLTPKPDPVLPDASFLPAEQRARITTPETRVSQQRHLFDLIVRHTRRTLALSFARTDAERTQREPSAVFLDVLAALGRPKQKPSDPDLPTTRALSGQAFVPDRLRTQALRTRTPLTSRARLDLVASHACTLPATRARGAVDITRAQALRTQGAPSALDGLLDVSVPDSLIPGLTAERPISPSALEKFASCPHWMLFAYVFRWSEPDEAPATREIGQPDYGSLVHGVLSAFYAEHGDAFFDDPERAKPGRWDRALARVAERELGALLLTYPLIGDGTRRQQLQRLLLDAQAALDTDAGADAARRRFAAAEKQFTTTIDAGGTLHVTGRIDRIDIDGGAALVRDFKTGKPKPRYPDDEADPMVDMQVGIYGLVAPSLLEEKPAGVGVEYVYLRSGHWDVRSYRHDYATALEPQARKWLASARSMLAARQFPRSHDEDDCRYCAFKPVCGPGAAVRAGRVREDAAEQLVAFETLKPYEGGNE